MNKVLGDKRAIALLVGPALLIYTLVMLVPIFWSLGYTFFQGNAIVGFHYSGLANITRLFTDPALRAALWFTVRYGVVLTAGQVLCGYLLALFYVFVLKRSSSFIRTLIFSRWCCRPSPSA